MSFVKLDKEDNQVKKLLQYISVTWFLIFHVCNILDINET